MFKERKDILRLAEARVSGIISTYNVSMSKEITIIKHDFVNRGLYHSGPYIEKLLVCITDMIMDSCNKVFEELSSLQTSQNINYNKHEINLLNDKINFYFSDFINLAFSNHLAVNCDANLLSSVHRTI